MNQLQLCKLFAELEFGGLLDESVVELDGKLVLLSEMGDIMFEDNDIDYPLEFNPITDLALTMKAIIDYGVEIERNGDGGYIYLSGEAFMVSFKSKEEIPHAIIECILKSEGKL